MQGYSIGATNRTVHLHELARENRETIMDNKVQVYLLGPFPTMKADVRLKLQNKTQNESFFFLLHFFTDDIIMATLVTQ